MINRWKRGSVIEGTKRYHYFREAFIAGIILLIVYPFFKEGLFKDMANWLAVICFLVATICVAIDISVQKKEEARIEGSSIVILIIMLALAVFSGFFLPGFL